MTEPIDLYRAVGSLEGCRKLSATFYSHVAHDALLRPLFPSRSFRCAIEALADYLSQTLGGPCEYSHRHWPLSLRDSHARFTIGKAERDAWMANMLAALDDVRIVEPARGVLLHLFEQASAYLVNDGPSATVQQWDVEVTLDEVVNAIRNGDATRAISIAGSQELKQYFKRDPAALVKLLELMSRDAGLLDYVLQTLRTNPELVRQSYARGRTLLHGAAGAGNLPVVDLLLCLGADPNSVDHAGHAPLYCVGNECSTPGGGDVVRALVQAGAHVDASGGVKHCTALHMAARRGHVEVAQALLNAGADVEAKDSRGDTPLRRAINCRKPAMIALLRSVS